MMQEFLLGIVEITLGMSLLILLMLVLLKLIGGKFTAKCRYILWTLVMIRLAIPLGFGILPALIEVPVETEPEGKIIAVIPDMEMSAPPQIIRDPLIYSRDTPVDYIPVPSEPEPFASESVTEEPITWEDVKTYIPHIYLIGTAIFLLWNLLSYWIYTAKILHTAKEVYPETQKIYEAVCRKKGLSRPPVLLVSPDVNSPAAFGLLRRRIVLPEIDFTENGLAGTLSHEVTHCRRGDLWIKAVCLLARSCHWFNPLVHLAAFRCEMEMELSCDESVLAGCSEDARAAYGEVMLDIIKRCRRNRGALTTHFNPKKNAVKARFTNILYGSGKRRGLWLIAVCLVMCLVAGAIVACRTEKDDVQETQTDPLPDGETVEIPLIYKQYTPELSQDMFVEEIQETELTEILQDQELCGVRVILYLDENKLFCAAYEKDDTLFRFIRTGGVEPVSYAAEEFHDILEADGFTVSWSWSHRFRAYFTVEEGAPELYLDAYDNVTEADYDNDDVTEVICQSMISVAIYDIADGALQTVAFDSELIQPKPGEFYRYLPDKNWFEFDYKKGGEDTLFHRYGTVQDGMLTLVTPDETIDTSETGEFPTMEAYVTDHMAKETTAQYFAAEPDGSFSNKQKTANVTDTKLLHLEKKGELADLAPEGVLECWEYKYLIKLDVPAEEIVPVGGQEVKDGWFDLEGQNGHTTVALRYPDGTYTVLRDENIADRIDFTGYRNSYEEAIYDWYVTEYDLALPLYVEEWGNLITPPEGERIGNTPVHRFDGEGWGIYIPVQAWYSSTDAMENQWLWRSSYNTGSTLMVDVFIHSLEDEYVTAEKQGYTPADSTNRVWENHTDGLHSCYYYYENPSGGFWRVTIEWTDEGVTNDNANIVIEPQILRLMAEKFVMFGAENKANNALTVTSPIYLCDDVYRSETTPTHGESTITFPAGLNGYKLYTCEVLLCGDGCNPHDVVWRNFFGYAGGYDLQEMELTRTGSYPAKLYLMEYPEDIVAQILSDMEKGGASEEEKLAYRNRRWYLYLLMVDADHYACIFLEPENMAARPENEQEILDAMVASVEINLILPEPGVELVSYPYTDRVFPVPEYWEEEQIAVLEYTNIYEHPITNNRGFCMLFSGTVFLLLFLPLLLLVYFVIPNRYLSVRNAVLILFSLIFYSFGGIKYTAFLLLSALLNYLGALTVSVLSKPRYRRTVMILTVLVNLTLLGYFKYASFAVSIINSLGGSYTVPEIVLPLGISFYTFQGMSYLLDVYTGKSRVQKNPFLVLLYIILFPQLVAGPIVNYSDIADELSEREHNLTGFSEGVTRFMLGFGKKMILSGAMGEIADEVFRIPLAELPASAAWAGAFAYLFQIYFDFSGYSDMAIGLGRIFGFRFPENFNYPYIADSVTDFWRRWHITLSRWFRDYVYIPLGGNRCSMPRQIRNLLVVWFLTGLWHGANWTFIVWGLYYAAFLLLEKFILKDILTKVPKFLRHAGTLLIVLCGWVFFRAESLTAAVSYLSSMFGFGQAVSAGQAEYYLRQYWIEWLLCAAASVPLIPWLKERFSERTWAYTAGKACTWLIFLYSYIKLVTGSFNPFIYFHF